MTKKDQALRLTLIFLRTCVEGYQPSKEEFKRMANLCGIVLPMKYRLSKADLDEIKRLAYEKVSESPEISNKAAQKTPTRKGVLVQ